MQAINVDYKIYHYLNWYLISSLKLEDEVELVVVMRILLFQNSWFIWEESGNLGGSKREFREEALCVRLRKEKIKAHAFFCLSKN